MWGKRVSQAGRKKGKHELASNMLVDILRQILYKIPVLSKTKFGK